MLACAQTRFPCPDNRLGLVGHLQLAEDVRDVVADGLLPYAEPPRDLGIVLSPHDQVQDLPFSFGKVREGLRRLAALG